MIPSVPTVDQLRIPKGNLIDRSSNQPCSLSGEFPREERIGTSFVLWTEEDSVVGSYCFGGTTDERVPGWWVGRGGGGVGGEGRGERGWGGGGGCVGGVEVGRGGGSGGFDGWEGGVGGRVGGVVVGELLDAGGKGERKREVGWISAWEEDEREGRKRSSSQHHEDEAAQQREPDSFCWI